MKYSVIKTSIFHYKFNNSRGYVNLVDYMQWITYNKTLLQISDFINYTRFSLGHVNKLLFITNLYTVLLDIEQIFWLDLSNSFYFIPIHLNQKNKLHFNLSIPHNMIHHRSYNC